MYPGEVGAAEVCRLKIETPMALSFESNSCGRPTMDHFQHRRDVGAKSGHWIGFSVTRVGLFPGRPLAHERRQRLHHRPIQVSRWAILRLLSVQGFPGETLQCVYATNSHLHFVVGQLLDRLAEGVGDASCTIGPGLLLVPTTSDIGLTECGTSHQAAYDYGAEPHKNGASGRQQWSGATSSRWATYLLQTVLSHNITRPATPS